MHIGHIPLVGLVSLTRVWVPVVDLAFRYEELGCTRSVNFFFSFTFVKLRV